jgi:hypothetical protein
MNLQKLVFGLGCILAISSCTKSNSEYDPNYNPQLGISIPDGFNWSTTKTVKTVINVSDAYNGKFYYNVNIYPESPTETSKPIAFGEANINEPFVRDITIPASVSKVYVVQSLRNYNGTEDIISTKEVSVSDLANVTLTRSAVTRGNGNNIGNTLDYMTDLNGSDNWAEITTTDGSLLQLNQGVNYVVKKDAYFTIKAQSMNNCIIYVKKGVHVIIDQRNLGNQVTVGESSKLYNDGCITVIGDGSTFSIKNDGGFYNNGTLITPNLDMTGNYGSIILCNNNYIKTGKLDISGGIIMMNTGAWIQADNIVMDKGQPGLISLTDDATNISGYNYSALITVKNLSENQNGITIKGNNNAKLLVQCPSQPIPLDANAEYTTDATSLINIAQSACSEGFGVTSTQYAGTTYAMEDQFPSKGDFDLNDVVVKIYPTVSVKKSESTSTTSVTISGKLLAVGGLLKCAGYVELYDDNGNKIDTKQLFDDAHQKMGVIGNGFINTEANAEKVTPADIIATFNNVSGITNFDPAKNMKFYITANGGSPIYCAEDGGINPSNKQIIGGIRIFNYNFSYPLETVDITDAYNEDGHQISKWIESNTTTNTDWYKFPTSGKVY